MNKTNGMIPIVEGQTWRPKWLHEIEIKDGITVGGLINRMNALHEAYNLMAGNLKNATIIDKDKEYIIEIDGELKRVTNPQLFKSVDLKMPIEYYIIENNKLVLNKKKVGAL